jgi:protein-S-isoprenylcysteine O-methyltransferase Ste14
VLPLYIISGALIIVGVVIWIIAARTIFMMYELDRVYKDGLYACCRHPLYANFIFVLIPGFCLPANSWLILSTPIFMYIVFKIHIREEEQSLIEQFGEAYLEYKKEVNSVFPKF